MNHICHYQVAFGTISFFFVLPVREGFFLWKQERFYPLLQVREGCVQVFFFSNCLFQKKYAYGKTTSLYALHLLQEASSAIPLFSPVIVPMAQSFGPILSQLTSYPTIRFGVRYVSVTLVSTLFLEMFNTYAGYFFMLTLLMFTLG